MSDIKPITLCGETKAPRKGWTCTRTLGHLGPCALMRKPSRFGWLRDSISEGLGKIFMSSRK